MVDGCIRSPSSFSGSDYPCMVSRKCTQNSNATAHHLWLEVGWQGLRTCEAADVNPRRHAKECSEAPMWHLQTAELAATEHMLKGWLSSTNYRFANHD